jgi:prepilin signal peptidase PulO-like enzyme (type II secretory pathway)
MTTLPQPRPAPFPRENRSPLWLRIGFWICIVIAVAVVLRRLFALAAPSHNGPPQMAGLDDAFASHAALTIAHIVPAILFVLLTPLAVFARFAHLRWPEHVLFPLGAVVGVTAYAMASYAVGGWIERSAIYLFDTLFLYSLVRAFRYGQLADMALRRRWLLRSIAILLGIATARPVMGVFFATSPRTHLQPSQFFGIAMWLGFSINLLVFELWIRSVDRRMASAPPSRTSPVR